MLDHFTGWYDRKAVSRWRIEVYRRGEQFRDCPPLRILRLAQHQGYQSLSIDPSASLYTVIVYDYYQSRSRTNSGPSFDEYRVTRNEVQAITNRPTPQGEEVFMEVMSTRDLKLNLQIPAERVVLACILVAASDEDYAAIVLPARERFESKKDLELQRARRDALENQPLIVWPKEHIMSKAVQNDQGEAGGENTPASTEEDSVSNDGNASDEAEAGDEDPRFQSRLTVERMVRERTRRVKTNACKETLLQSLLEIYGPPS